MIPLLPMNGAQNGAQTEAQMEVPNRRYAQDGLYSHGSFFCVIWTFAAICIVFGVVLTFGVFTFWKNQGNSSLAFTYQPPSYGNYSGSSLEIASFLNVITVKQPIEKAYITTTELITAKRITTKRIFTEKISTKRTSIERITTWETVPTTTEQPLASFNTFRPTKKIYSKEVLKDFWQKYFMLKIAKLNPVGSASNDTRLM